MMKFPESMALSEVEQLVDALSRASQLDRCPRRLQEFLQTSAHDFLNRPAHCHLVLADHLDRTPAPRILHRFMISPDVNPVADDRKLQQFADQCAPYINSAMGQPLNRLTGSQTVVASDDLNQQWLHEVYIPRILEPAGLVDSLFTLMRPTDDRLIVLTLHRAPGETPFGPIDRTRASLLLRGVAPLVDWDLFKESDVLNELALTARQREVLLELLKGKSEKEIAARLHRSLHTIHTHVKQLYERFEVSSRGQLMARFVDQALIDQFRNN